MKAKSDTNLYPDSRDGAVRQPGVAQSPYYPTQSVPNLERGYGPPDTSIMRNYDPHPRSRYANAQWTSRLNILLYSHFCLSLKRKFCVFARPHSDYERYRSPGREGEPLPERHSYHPDMSGGRGDYERVHNMYSGPQHGRSPHDRFNNDPYTRHPQGNLIFRGDAKSKTKKRRCLFSRADGFCFCLELTLVILLLMQTGDMDGLLLRRSNRSRCPETGVVTVLVRAPTATTPTWSTPKSDRQTAPTNHRP